MGALRDQSRRLPDLPRSGTCRKRKSPVVRVESGIGRRPGMTAYCPRTRATLKCARRPDGRARGFSLIELVLVVATIAVLSAIAVPKYADAMNRYRVDLAAKRVVADFALARSSARGSGLGQVV